VGEGSGYPGDDGNGSVGNDNGYDEDHAGGHYR
jgi:hypothetical protein